MSVWSYSDRMDIATLTGTPSETLAGASLKTGIARNTLRRRLARPGLFLLDEIDAIAAAYNADSLDVVARIKAHTARSVAA